MPSIRTLLHPLAALLLLFSAPCLAQERPSDTSICDYYAKKTVGGNTAADQMMLMQLVLHSALLGPFSKYNTVKSPPEFTGALQPATFLGEYADLRPYFNGGFASTNTGKDKGVAVDFFDDGGVDALKLLKPSNGNTTSHQYTFTTHVYSYFGTVFNCSHLGSKELPQYAGKASMYEVHKFMDLNKAEMGYFIQQAVLGLKSIGFTTTDVAGVNATLDKVFNHRCAPAMTLVPPTAGPQLQAICIASDCPLATNDTCPAYGTQVAPAVADAALVGNYSKAADGTTSLNTSSAPAGGAAPTTTKGSGASNLGRVCTELFGMFWAGLLIIGLLL